MSAPARRCSTWCRSRTSSSPGTPTPWPKSRAELSVFLGWRGFAAAEHRRVHQSSELAVFRLDGAGDVRHADGLTRFGGDHHRADRHVADVATGEFERRAQREIDVAREFDVRTETGPPKLESRRFVRQRKVD